MALLRIASRMCDGQGSTKMGTILVLTHQRHHENGVCHGDKNDSIPGHEGTSQPFKL